MKIANRHLAKNFSSFQIRLVHIYRENGSPTGKVRASTTEYFKKGYNSFDYRGTSAEWQSVAGFERNFPVAIDEALKETGKKYRISKADQVILQAVAWHSGRQEYLVLKSIDVLSFAESRSKAQAALHVYEVQINNLYAEIGLDTPAGNVLLGLTKAGSFRGVALDDQQRNVIAKIMTYLDLKREQNVMRNEQVIKDEKQAEINFKDVLANPRVDHHMYPLGVNASDTWMEVVKPEDKVGILFDHAGFKFGLGHNENGLVLSSIDQGGNIKTSEYSSYAAIGLELAADLEF